jgi:hypothetical protein
MKQNKTTRKDPTEPTVVIQFPHGKPIQLTALDFSRVPSDLEILIATPIDPRIDENRQFTHRNISIDFSDDGNHNYEVQDNFRNPNDSKGYAATDYSLAELDLMKTN